MLDTFAASMVRGGYGQNPSGKGVGKENAPMALGDQIGEVSGKITGTRVVTPSGSQTQIEVSF